MWEESQDLEGSGAGARAGRGPVAGQGGQHLGQLPAVIPGPPLQRLRRAQPPQCTAPPPATAAAGGGDGIPAQFIPHSGASSAYIAA